MNSDTKVGLALGILVVGIAAAFFFRLPPSTGNHDRVRALAPGIAEIDQELKHRANRPYLPPVPAHDINGDHESQQVSAFPQQDQILYTGHETAPEPVQLEPMLPTAENNLEPGQLAAISAPVLVSTETKNALENKFTGGMKQHVVKNGETLSSIAHHFLGSPVRYREIYTVNQEQLESPDALRPGMTLNIPLRDIKTTNTNIATANTDVIHQDHSAMFSAIPNESENPHSQAPVSEPLLGTRQKKFTAVRKLPSSP